MLTFIRRFDDIGRIAIPLEVRRELMGASNAGGMKVDILMRDEEIIIKKHVETEDEKDLIKAIAKGKEE